MADDERRAEIEALTQALKERFGWYGDWPSRVAQEAIDVLDRVRDARGNEAYDPRPAEVARLARIEEIDIVARTWWAHESGHKPWRDVVDAVKNAYKARAGEAIAALDRLREE